MNAKELDRAPLEITGRKEPMVPFGLRLPKRDAKVLRATAKRNKCKGADLLRTAWQEYRITHLLGED